MYDFQITTPAATAKSSPQRTELVLTTGVIDQVQIAFPPGPSGLLHVLIQVGSSTLWPRNEGEGFAWDDFTIDFRPLYELRNPPVLEAVTWNEDDFYEHLVTIRINLIPPELAFGSGEELGILQRLERAIFGRR